MGRPVHYIRGHCARKFTGPEYELADLGYETPCWQFRGHLDPQGYGRLCRGGHRLAHRVYYTELVGAIPEGLVIDHLCRQHGCVNPAHLQPVAVLVNWWRGESPTRLNVEKTHCPHGHAYTEDNLVPSARKRGRACRTCHREAVKRCNRKRRDREMQAA